MKKLVGIFLCLMLLSACGDNAVAPKVGAGNKYSHNFEITETDVGYDVNFPGKSNSLHLSRGKCDSAIQIPVESVVCLSTTYSAFITQLSEMPSIKGISGTRYVCDTLLQSEIMAGRVAEVGYDQQLDMERILAINPDVVFAYGVDNESMTNFNKLQKTGINVVMVDDYLESKPLGRTEWIKFFGCFYDKFEYASHYFDSVESQYLRIKHECDAQEKPKVLVSLPWKGTWWVPGGDSFFANFVKDAGGKYVFDNDATESLPYSVEQVFSQASGAEIWLHPNEKTKRLEILDVDSRLANFGPYNNARIYNNNKICSKYGGSDFWESGIVHPDIILHDLQNIFSGKDENLHYYLRLE